MGKYAESKSPTVRLQMTAPLALSARIWAEILRISEPTMPRARDDTPASGSGSAENSGPISVMREVYQYGAWELERKCFWRDGYQRKSFEIPYVVRAPATIPAASRLFPPVMLSEAP